MAGGEAGSSAASGGAAGGGAVSGSGREESAAETDGIAYVIAYVMQLKRTCQCHQTPRFNSSGKSKHCVLGILGS